MDQSDGRLFMWNYQIGCSDVRQAWLVIESRFFARLVWRNFAEWVFACRRDCLNLQRQIPNTVWTAAILESRSNRCQLIWLLRWTDYFTFESETFSNLLFAFYNEWIWLPWCGILGVAKIYDLWCTFALCENSNGSERWKGTRSF